MRIKILASVLVFIFLSGFISPQLSEADVVYVIPGEKIFHLDNCEKLGNKKTGMSLGVAIKKGYEPCPECILSKGIKIYKKSSSTVQEDIGKRRRNYIDKHPELSQKIKKAILYGDVLIGMNTEQVIASRGRPHKISKTTTRFGVHEQWIMYFSGGPRSYDLKGQEYGYIYLENGKVTSWQSWR